MGVIVNRPVRRLYAAIMVMMFLISRGGTGPDRIGADNIAVGVEGGAAIRRGICHLGASSCHAVPSQPAICTICGFSFSAASAKPVAWLA